MRLETGNLERGERQRDDLGFGLLALGITKRLNTSLAEFARVGLIAAAGLEAKNGTL